MLEKFIHHVRENKILDVNAYYLLAVSGGIDSVALAHLLERAGFGFGMVHCNFQLRGEESEGDEAFVRQLAADLGVEIMVKRFDTEAYRAEQGGSVQMAARDLRYGWFSALMDKHEADGVILAHHADDQVETVLLNLLRGTGIEGVYGMADIREGFIRPLLPFTREEIVDFVRKEGLTWREDSSNEKDDYKRNFLRHRVIPLLHELDPKSG
jgi:tRNA(Ile)-lysidine synthase